MGLFKHKIAIDGEFMERIKTHVERVGYSSVDEFVHHCIEKELKSTRAADDEMMTERLRGLGYIE